MSNFLPDGLISFGPLANCTLDTCPIEASILQYQPEEAASGAFVGLFGLAMIAHAVEGAWFRSWGFMVCMLCGCILEIAGYAGRIILHDNPFDFNGFILQIVCITIAPVFFCAAIYVTLAQVIAFTDPTISRFNPKLFYWVFIPCDVISLILQATGGALSCVSDTQAEVQVGVNISLAGLVFQVATLIVFCVLFADYFISCKRSPSWTRIDGRMKFFLAFQSLATFLILLRCVYRIVELHDGYFSDWFRDEPLFIALESAVMSAAVISLLAGHPGPVFGHKGRNSEPKVESETRF